MVLSTSWAEASTASHLTRWLVSWAILFTLTTLSPSADAFQCHSAPDVKVIGLSRRAPVNAQFYLQVRRSTSAWKEVRIVDAETKAALPFTALTDPLRLRPDKPLTPDRRYSVWLGEKRLAGFKAIPTAEPGAPPKLSIRFSPPHHPKPNTPPKQAQYKGRSAYIVSKARRDDAPAVFIVSARLWSKKDKDQEPLVLNHTIPYRSEAEFASTKPCRVTSTPAPNRGRYEVTVTPWWPDGRHGEPVTLKGTIR